jgi:energy-coupling factor transporter ATP-binding protein EcfA2
VRITSLTVTNLRALENVDLRNLKDFVLIAGPNGCGKTTVLDAIRLVKSIYVQDEYKRWFSEFGVNIDRAGNWGTLFRDKTKPISIRAVFELSVSERDFLASHADDIALASSLMAIPDRKGGISTITGEPPLMPPDLPSAKQERVRRDSATSAAAIRTALASSREFAAAVELQPVPSITLTESPIAKAAFSCFNPDHLGEVEFHSSRRSYARESVENVRLKLASRAEERRNRYLYDLENKYKNIKTQLGEEYVAAILRRESPDTAPLQRSIKELFVTFFPGKEFLGVSLGPDNALSFPVRLSTGETHDIDELSSGEKEIVYGYLWLRTGTPKRSVILVDEPELHLNPALVQGLPSFYKTHLADALDAQVWIVTHSDAILRQAVRSPSMSVFHMARPQGDGQPQARLIDSRDAVEAAVLDLIGDLAAYRPHAKIVLVEGNRETRFDVDMIRRLFPEVAEQANLIPVGPRRMTSGVRERLVEVIQEAGLAGRAVSISDGDLGRGEDSEGSGHFAWPVYEIENFLLAPSVIRAAAMTLTRTDPFSSDTSVVTRLQELARPLVAEMAVVEMRYRLNGEFMGALSIGGDPIDPVGSFRRATGAAQSRVAAIDTSEVRLSALFVDCERRFRDSLASEEFLTVLPGDRLLRALAGDIGVPADHFRNVCLDAAQRLGLRPQAMEAVLQQALA